MSTAQACGCDKKEQRKVSEAAVAEFCAKIGAPYIETSAKTGEGVEECFRAVANIIYELRKKPIYRTATQRKCTPPSLEEPHHSHHHHHSIFSTVYSWFSRHHHHHHHETESNEKDDDTCNTVIEKSNEVLSEDQLKPDYERLQKLPRVVWPPIIEAIDNAS